MKIGLGRLLRWSLSSSCFQTANDELGRICANWVLVVVPGLEPQSDTSRDPPCVFVVQSISVRREERGRLVELNSDEALDTLGEGASSSEEAEHGAGGGCGIGASR